ncbi:hypothetical protein CI102_13094 [Trichoderma harzianum]|uniref:O-methyltransferase dimerisation domain-containing protein n=1 Tax=Trichoderma harzianum CBS 226.95 TaxID=983964 RepID=A0A2T4AG58_TRIHA|nr:hypothetical protein M431DRAFT_519581 [Trichoderma harzianum CBS 226.95]PKK42302.1 hypothetical protein CI102_13094 [Trichoderma harzianum]PTB56013.1 hypothetical protein M431DRAFT_519581 [Trichoderma harzianum CBS 226.95]
MDSETSMDSDTTMDSEDAAPLKGSMGRLAKEITTQVKTWEQYQIEHGMLLTTSGFDRYLHGDRSKLLPQMPCHVVDARETIIDSALKLLDQVAGPSKMISLALSQVQFVSALKWLLHFKIFDLVPKDKAVTYKSLAEKANVPASELMRMLRMAMAYKVFLECGGGIGSRRGAGAGDAVRHNRFSSILARDENFLHGLPFFCDTVMPASAKIVDTTMRWKGSQEKNEAAWNLASGHEISFDQHLSQHDQTSGYDCLMNVFDNGRSHSLLAAHWAEVVHGTINWSSLGKGAPHAARGVGS